MKKSALLITVTVAFFAACKKDSASTSGTSLDCSTIAATYNADVSPIITSSCATTISCHAAGSSRGPGALTSYQLVYNSRSAIRSAVASGAMPQGSTLSATAKNKILCWIDNGAGNN